MTTTAPITRTPGVLEAEVDGERVLMHPTDYTYYGLSETGAAVWSLVDGTRGVDEIAAVLTEQFDGDPAVITADVRTFVAGLEAGRLVTITD